ncbi:potassium channel subunit-like protein [Leptomonas pyrrhocoris]|uniref:Potassium channel subunit-like protein n=1 Tax=Leptomonas pyrrhocoris TaxID=157538 RepID=A0A0N0DQU7_LEPPY|nr:potassium channel subunit-like protein [Leptomonas pyrrhocoris]KPA73792.1 potassium channel subunit-like protein [Leptomonas pyrrhocoris]|eukprot:XP_015652231.1 potassium channel subunit-like protein [Leptomonas pyrrhocoris]
MASSEVHVADTGVEAADRASTAHPITTANPDGTLPAYTPSRFDPKEFMTQLGQDVQDTIRSRFYNLQGTLHSQIRNLRNNMVNLGLAQHTNAEELRHRSVYHYDHGEANIRSVRKLFDVIEQHHSWVSILLLMTDVGLEAAAVGIYLGVQRAHVPRNWLAFDWGTGCFISEVVLCVLFMSSWLALLAVEPKKWAYVFNVKSLMSYLSSGWMLLLGVGALCSQNAAWTRVYAPMFLRIWWLHEGLLTLLSYPQISLCFAENRLEMLRSMIQCIAVIGISVGILQAVESFCGDPVEYFDMAYMMLLAFSTIGYGDVVPITVEGRLLMIVFIGVGLSYFVPILEYVADLGVRHLFYAHYTTWFKRSNHIVICGHLGYNELRMQLKNILAEDRHYLNMNVVILLRDQPSAQVELLLNSPKYRSSVHLLVGDPANPADLDRCNARGASALFLYGAGTNSSYYSDYDLAKQALTAHLHVPRVPLYVLLHRSRYTKSLMPCSANVLEFERMSHNLLGLGCVLPGMIPLLANLIRMFDPMTTESLWELRDFKDLFGLSGRAASLKALRKVWAKKRDMLTYGATSIELGDGAEPDWMSTYEASLAQHVDAVEAPEVVRQGHYTFVSLARLLYRTDITLIGVERPVVDARRASGDTVVELGTRSSLVGVRKLIVICDARRKAQDIVNEIVRDSRTSPSTMTGTPSRKDHGRRKTRRSASSSPPPPAGVQATNVTVLNVPNTENAGDVAANASMHPDVQDGGAAPVTASAVCKQPSPASPLSPPPHSSTVAALAAAAAAAAVGAPTAAPPVVTTTKTCTPTAKSASSPLSTAAVVMRPRKDSAGESGTSSLLPGVHVDAVAAVHAGEGVSFLSLHSLATPTNNNSKHYTSNHPHNSSSSSPQENARHPSPPPSTRSISTPVVASPSDSLRIPHASSKRDLEVPLSNPAANLALATAAEEDDEVAVEAIASPVVVQRVATSGLSTLSSVASPTLSAHALDSVSARGQLLPPRTTTSASSSPHLPQQQQQQQQQHGIPSLQERQPTTGAVGSENRAPCVLDDGYSGYVASPSGIIPGANTILRFEPNVLHLRHHYVFIDLSAAHERTNWSREAAVESRTAKAADLYDAMRPVRQHDPESDIVLLSNDTNYDSLNNLWEEEDVTGSLVVVQGCGLFTSDLRRCNVSQAAAVVIFSAGDRCDEHGDSLSVLVMHLVRHVMDEEKSGGGADIPVVVEVDHAELVPFITTSYMTTGAHAQTSSDWVSEPSFMSGCVVCRHMLDTGLQEMYFTPLLHEVLEQILSSKSESLLVTVMAPDEAWEAYEDATNFGLANDLLPMAIHRLHEMLGEESSVSFRYIITNPPPTFPLRRDDFIYCLKL